MQQEWLRQEFQRRMGPLPVVVARPFSSDVVDHDLTVTPAGPTVFLYPALPRAYKNMETLCEAAKVLISRGVTRFEVRLTTDGSDSRYAKWLRRRYSGVSAVRFIGRQSREEMVDQYRDAHAVVFPSKLETWGLPISEAKAHRLPLLVADLPYAHESVGTYASVSFFPAESAQVLADLMESVVDGTWKPTGSLYADPPPPFAPDWSSLWKILTVDL